MILNYMNFYVPTQTLTFLYGYTSILRLFWRVITGYTL